MATSASTACATRSVHRCTSTASRPASLRRPQVVVPTQAPCRSPRERQALQHSLHRCRAEGGDGQPQGDGEEPSSSVGSDAAPGSEGKSEEPVKGQTTAIVTGALSILFGVAYLALVQLMDSRGADLLPPPPEAFL